ncbi:MAG: DeoR family transcriptional regulator [SAR324 cluster bacterium]|nr:DeoR family transcriptional regulator [SAR324 cluster bacterium]
MFCNITELAEVFSVSDETVCRDVRQLAEMHLVRKVHRGVATLHETMESPFQKRIAEQHEEKHQIAEICSELFPDGTTLMLDCGTTTSYVARSLAKHKDLTLITNSTDIT